MTVVEKFVPSMRRPSFWVSLLILVIQLDKFYYELWIGIKIKYLKTFGVNPYCFAILGTLLMTPERRRAIWAIYGEFVMTSASII